MAWVGKTSFELVILALSLTTKLFCLLPFCRHSKSIHCAEAE
jgi:hypothetical protein